MVLFRRILNFKKSQARQIERRLEQRYPPGRHFPLTATIEVKGEPRNAKILDLSPRGVGLQVAGPSYVKGSAAKLHLMLEETWMEFPCRIAHIKSLPVGARLGLTAQFETFATQKAFLQLLQPVVLGSALRPVAPDEVRQFEAGRHKVVLTGLPGSELNVWRQDDATGEFESFLWQMDDYLVRGDALKGGLQVSSRKQMARPSEKLLGIAPPKLPEESVAEIRLLFRWTMLNLPKEVPADIRTFLQGFAG